MSNAESLRKIGREMRQQLQQKNGLTVEILNVEFAKSKNLIY
jgi:hypothetical protein